ncbi:MAG: ATP-dependent DNA helicase [Betaproteobacteria bacterium]|nr:ATP-dependent DNA helicase [Betaproteobacteria bacterium]
MLSLDALFGDSGPLAQAIQGYRLRPGQIEMAQAISRAIERQGCLIAEAGTGTGKTFAYLVPALLSGGKVIISTGTKMLQDQLFSRDLPVVRQALKVPVTIALLKGRANYVCHYHLERQASEGRFASREDVQHLAAIRRFARTTTSGDKGLLKDVPEGAPIWPQVTSTRENCLGQECPHLKECFVMGARAEAQQADVVVVNHHLFFADLWLRDEGVGELLPACNTVIFDEAHQLPETASLFFGDRVSSSQLLELARDAGEEAAIGAKDFAELPPACDALAKVAADWRLSVVGMTGRLPAQAALAVAGFADALDGAVRATRALVNLLAAQSERSPGLENCHQRALALLGQLESWRSEDEGTHVRWIEIFSQSVQLNATPLSVAEIFEKSVSAAARAWIFTSATLSVKRDFRHYQSEMGLAAAETACWESPFDFGRQALLYVPTGLPDPNTSAYTRAAVDAALPILKASRGRAFFLFTSLKAMKEAHDLLKEAFTAQGLDYPLLVQGERSRGELLAQFRAHGHAVLLGSQTFWEGVDVRGEALSLVIIDRLPFAPPDDPVLAARIARINRAGRNAFMEYQLPRAVISLKQGAGRLIRGPEDRGVLMICDPRLLSKPYGGRIWQSLPPMGRTRDRAVVEGFFRPEADLTHPGAAGQGGTP